MHNHDQVIAEQFGSTAAAYLTSTVHAQGADLQDLAAYAQQYAQPVILDMGCGGGHASFVVAPHAKQVTAYDLSVDMLDVVCQAAAERKLDNIETRQGSADCLPFADAMFDIVCTAVQRASLAPFAASAGGSGAGVKARRPLYCYRHGCTG